MDRRSWLWRRKSSEKSTGETESSGSLSSVSGKYSDDQEVVRSFSPNQVQSPDVSSRSDDFEDHDVVKDLKKKLSDALSNIRAKEDLAKQHAQVAEEAVSGWEKAEIEVASLKQQLDIAAEKNFANEERISHLDKTMKECLRQLRQTREEQEKNIHIAVIQKSQDWAAKKIDLESQVEQLESLLKDLEVEPSTFAKLEALEKENKALKQERRVLSEQLRVQILESEYSVQVAETASKHHLKSIKKMTKLEAECRSLRALVNRRQLSCNQTPLSNFIFVQSTTNDQLGCGEQKPCVNNHSSCLDSGLLGLTAELDQFNNKKHIRKNEGNSSELDIMDDFLEMEKLAASSEDKHGSVDTEPKVDSDQSKTENSLPKSNLEVTLQRMNELEEEIITIKSEKVALEDLLADTQEELETMSKHLKEAEIKIVELAAHVETAHASKKFSELAIEAAELKTKGLESELRIAVSEVNQLRKQVILLEEKAEKERELAEQLAKRCLDLEGDLSERRNADSQRVAKANEQLKIKQEKEFGVATRKLVECQKTIASLGRQLTSLKTFEDFILDDSKNEESFSPTGREMTVLARSASLENANISPILSNENERGSPSTSSSSSGFL